MRANQRCLLSSAAHAAGDKIMTEKHRAYICLIAGLFTVGVSEAARSLECFPGPDFQPPSGARWQYQADPATKQGCWYVEEPGARSRRRTGTVVHSSRPIPATSERTSALDAPPSERRDVTPAVAPLPSIRAWFSSKLSGFTDSFRAYSPIETEQDATTTLPPTPKRRPAEAMPPRKTERKSSEQRSNVAQRKPVLEKGKSAAAQQRYSTSAVALLETAGDKPVAGVSSRVGHELQKAVEAVGDKDVVTATASTQEDWQRALYEEFLLWRVRQVMP
jgi:hypothetical protein